MSTARRVGRDAIVSITYTRKNPDRVCVLRQASGKWAVHRGARLLGKPFAEHKQAIRFAHTAASAP